MLNFCASSMVLGDIFHMTHPQNLRFVFAVHEIYGQDHNEYRHISGYHPRDFTRYTRRPPSIRLQSCKEAQVGFLCYLPLLDRFGLSASRWCEKVSADSTREKFRAKLEPSRAFGRVCIVAVQKILL